MFKAAATSLLRLAVAMWCFDRGACQCGLGIAVRRSNHVVGAAVLPLPRHWQHAAVPLPSEDGAKEDRVELFSEPEEEGGDDEGGDSSEATDCSDFARLDEAGGARGLGEDAPGRAPGRARPASPGR